MRNTSNPRGIILTITLFLLAISVLPVCSQSKTQYLAKEPEYQLNLRDHVESLSSISTVHNMDFTGKGTTIAIISTGIDSNHEQLSGRVIAENCFNSGVQCVRTDRCDACGSDDQKCLNACYDCSDHFVCTNNGGSSNPVNADDQNAYNRGSHLAGIATGEDGVAPGANIVAVNIQSEYINHPDLITEDNPAGYGVSMKEADLKKALEWLLEIQEDLSERGTPISIVQIDFNSGEYDYPCDWEDPLTDFYDLLEKLSEAGMTLVAGTGDSYNDQNISFPACMSNVIAVGALADMDKPMIAAYSNHNDLIDILAPGSGVYSASLVDMDFSCLSDCYGLMTGTSQSSSVIAGALALLMEALPGKTTEEYKAMLTEMSPQTVNRRNSNTHNNLTSDDGTGTQFDFDKPILVLSGLLDKTDNTLVINDQIPQGPNQISVIGEVNTEDRNGIDADILSDQKRITTGNINAKGSSANGIDAIVRTKDGELAVNVIGNISAVNAGIVTHEDNGGPLDIFVTGTIDAGKVGILVAGSGTGTPNEDFPDNITITVEKITPNKRGNVAENEDGSKAANIENAINYIITADHSKSGRIEIVQKDGSPWTQKSHNRLTAKKGERVYFRAPEGLEVYDKNTHKVLPKTRDGLYYLDVPNGGSIHVYTRAKQTNWIEFFRLCSLPKTGFSAFRPQVLREQPLSIQYTSTNLTIQIPALSVDSEILLVPEIDGEYPVEWLGSSVGMLEGSKLPGEGVTILTGHNHLNNTENGPFLALGSLNEGDRVLVSGAGGKWYMYKVTGNYKVHAGAFDTIAENLGENTLVMITCEDESASGGYLHRRVIFADPL